MISLISLISLISVKHKQQINNIKILNKKSITQKENKKKKNFFSFLPKEFQKDKNKLDFPISIIYYKENLGVFYASIDKDKIKFKNAKNILKRMHLTSQAKEALITAFEKGIKLKNSKICNTQNNETCLNKNYIIEYRFIKKSLTLFINNVNKLFLENSSKHLFFLEEQKEKKLGSILNYSLNLIYSNNINSKNSSFLFSLNNILGYGVNSIITDLNLIKINKDNPDFVLKNLLYTKEMKKKYIRFGYSLFDEDANNKSIGFKFGSSNHLFKNKSNQAVNDITYFSKKPLDVFIFKDNKLISIQKSITGYNKLDTSTFPDGIYPIKIELKENNQTISSINDMVYKVFDISSFDPSLNMSYLLFYGLMSNTDNNAFKQPYLGGSITTVLNKNILSKITLAQLYNRSSLKFENNFIFLDKNINGNFNISLNSNKQFDIFTNVNFNILSNLSINTNYYYDSKVKNNQINLNLNYNSSIFGSLALLNKYSLNNKIYNSSIILNKSLLNTGEFNLSINLLYDIYSSNSVKNNYVALNFNYYLNQNNNLSAAITHQKSESSTDKSYSLTYEKRFDDLFIKNINANIYKSTKHETGTINSSFKNDKINGNLAVSNDLKERQNSANLNLIGSVAFNKDMFAFANKNAISGVLINLIDKTKNPAGVKINNNEYFFESNETTFIPLSENNTYTAYFIKSNSKNRVDYESNDLYEFTLYPGSIFNITNKAQGIFYISGKIKNYNKTENIEILSNIDTVSTDENGYFIIKITTDTKKLVVMKNNQLVCKVFLDDSFLKNPINGKWLGEIIMPTVNLSEMAWY